MKHIPDYDGFDPGLHEYVAASFGGDGWMVDPPVHGRLLAEALSIFEGELPSGFRLEDQIESLEIYERGDDDNPIAWFDFRAWKWLSDPLARPDAT